MNRYVKGGLILAAIAAVTIPVISAGTSAKPTPEHQKPAEVVSKPVDPPKTEEVKPAPAQPVATPPPAPKPVPKPVPKPAPQPVHYTSNPVLIRINDSRASKGLHKLTESARLNASAQAKCNDMVEKGYWSHDAPDGSSWGRFITGYNGKGEIQAKGFFGNDPAMHQAWLNSPGHYEAIMTGYFKYQGMARCTYSTGVDAVVVHFGG